MLTAFNIDGQAFWAINIRIVNSWIAFDKIFKCYEKNVNQLPEFLLLKKDEEFV